MYGFPKDFDAGTLVGRVLEAVTYASNVIVLAFEDEAVVSASAPITYSLAAGSDDVTESPTDRTGQLVGLVGLRVAGAEVASSTELVMDFGEGRKIVLRDNDEHYESFLINVGDSETVV